MKRAALAQALIAAGWTCTYAFAVWVVPGSLRKLIPYPFDLQAIHLLLDTLDNLGWAVALLLMAITAFAGRDEGSPKRWGLGFAGALGIAVCASLQRYLVYARVDDNLWDRTITYPMTPPMKEFDALMVRWQLVDLAMVVAGVIVAFAASRELLEPSPTARNATVPPM